MINGEVTPTEQAYLRSDHQASILGLAGLDAMPTVVFKARINQAFTTTDMQAEFIYDLVGITPVGAYGDVLPGMTVWIGSADGLYDIGMARARKAFTSTVAYIGEESELALVDDLFITVVNEYLIWPKHVFVDASSDVFMDHDVAYTDQHELFDPAPVMGGNRVGLLVADGIPTELDDNNVLITYSGFGVLSGGGRYGGSEHASNVTGEYYEYTFTGQRIQIIATKSSNYGKVAIYIDGALDTTIDQYNASEVFQQIVYDKVVANGVHTIKGIITGTKNIASSGYYGSLDAVIYETPAILADFAFDVSDSWVFDSIIASYVHTFPGAFSTTGLATATPTATYDVAGRFLWHCVVTANNGKTFTGTRVIYVKDPLTEPSVPFTINNCQGDFQSGGWSYDVVGLAGVEKTNVRDRAEVILYARDWYGDTEISIGPVAGCENVIAQGWIDGETINFSADEMTVSFSVKGANFWLDKMTGYPPGVGLAVGTASAWTEMLSLNVDRSVWHLLHWRSTVTAIMDVLLTGNTLLASEFESPSGSLWNQIEDIAMLSIFARPGVDPYGRFHLQVESQLVSVADRTWPTVYTFENADLEDGQSIKRIVVRDTSQVNFSGVSVSASGNGSAWFALSPGHVFSLYGKPMTADRLLLSGQADALDKAGLISGMKNNIYPSISVKLPMNFRAIGLWPNQYAHVAWLSTENARAIPIELDLVPRRITYEFDAEAMTIQTNVEFEGATLPDLSMVGDIPNVDDGDTTVPPVPEPPDPPIEPPGADLLGRPAKVLIHDVTHGLLYTENGDADNPLDILWGFVNGGLDDAHKQDVDKIFVTAYGKIYIGYVGDAKQKEIWYASAPGGIFTKIIDVDWVNAYFGATGGDIATMGINPLGSDQIAFIANDVANSPKLFIGNSSGFTASPALTNFSTAHGGWSLTFGGGKWRETGWGGGIFARTWLFVFDANGGGQIDIDMDTAPNNPGTNGLGTCHVGAGSSDRIFIIGAYGGNLWMVTGNGTLVDTGVSAPDSTGPGNSGWGFAVEPTGAHIMSNFGTVPNKSSDYGYTWSPMTAILPIGSYAFGWALYDVSRFVAALSDIHFTNNFGTDWVTMTGNLRSLIPSPVIDYIKVIE